MPSRRAEAGQRQAATLLLDLQALAPRIAQDSAPRVPLPDRATATQWALAGV
jgi:hypothetical protein